MRNKIAFPLPVNKIVWGVTCNNSAHQGLLIYSLHQTRKGSMRAVSSTPADWKYFYRVMGYRCIRVEIKVVKAYTKAKGTFK